MMNYDIVMNNDLKKELFKPGPLHPERHRIVKELLNLPVKTGDVFFRLDNYSFLGLPFSKIVAHATKSKYDHAAIAFVDMGEVYLVEVSDAGTQKIALIDWVDYCYSKEFSIYRVNDLSIQESVRLEKAIRDFLDVDPDYDFSFGRNLNAYYCTESVYKIYNTMGIKLAQPLMLKSIVKWWAYWLIAGVSFFTYRFTGKGIPTSVPLHIVGNNNWGLMSSKRLNHVKAVNL